MGTDKGRIWDDCAQCAYKHLTAAYAALTSPEGARMRVLPPWLVYTARAWIAYSESRTGYAGNLDLAAGCLAMAETCAPEETRAGLRSARLSITAGGEWGPEGLPVTDDAMAFAHVVEAFRELPELSDRWSASCFDFTATNGDSTGLQSVLDSLSAAIQWVAETFELGSAVSRAPLRA